MVGAKTSELLRRTGVETMRILSQVPVEMLITCQVKNGIELWRRWNVIDETAIVPYHEQKKYRNRKHFRKRYH